MNKCARSPPEMFRNWPYTVISATSPLLTNTRSIQSYDRKLKLTTNYELHLDEEFNFFFNFTNFFPGAPLIFPLRGKCVLGRSAAAMDDFFFQIFTRIKCVGFGFGTHNASVSIFRDRPGMFVERRSQSASDGKLFLFKCQKAIVTIEIRHSRWFFNA